MDVETEAGRADGLPTTVAEAIARRLAPLRLAGTSDPDGAPAPRTGTPRPPTPRGWHKPV